VTAAAGVRVLIVDDSPVAREVLKSVLEADAAIQVVGMAGTGREAVELTARLRPDLVTMDLVMPGMDGMEATQQIMARNPTPILFLSSFIGREGSYSRSDALAAGALDVVEKPSPMPDPLWQTDVLVRKVKSLARVTVIRHMYGASREDRRQAFVVEKSTRAAAAVVGIGASTGGPKVVDDLLAALPGNYGPAVLVVQHMAEGFMTAMVTTLRQRCALDIKVAEDGDRLQSGRVLFAPPSAHLSVVSGGRVRISDEAPVRGFRPSIDVMFASLARVYGARAAGVLLTGMGIDGASGLQAIRDAGGKTMVQDEATCVVFGMPRAAIELGAVQHVLPPAGLARHLIALHRLRPGKD
jgi:two-component system, chemotaxis family, protein-glutamate methylesterase/glutaminase